MKFCGTWSILGATCNSEECIWKADEVIQTLNWHIHLFRVVQQYRKEYQKDSLSLPNHISILPAVLIRVLFELARSSLGV